MLLQMVRFHSSFMAKYCSIVYMYHIFMQSPTDGHVTVIRKIKISPGWCGSVD